MSFLASAVRFSMGPFRPVAASFRSPYPRSNHVIRSMGSEGQIQSELMTQMRSKIQSALVAERVEVTDVQGDGRHVEIVVISKDFEGKTSVNRQRMVYKAIWEELQDAVHAVDAMVTQTPSEAGM